VFSIFDVAFAQENETDNADTELPYPISDGSSEPYRPADNSGFRLDPPSNLQQEIVYNPETGQYDVVEKVGAFETQPEYSMSLAEYQKYNSDNNKKDYWQRRSKADRTGDLSEFGPSVQVGGETFSRIFGSNNVEIKPEGSASLRFGVKRTSNKNPSYSKKQQRNTGFDFDNSIQMSVTGKVGEKVSMRIKYDTESQFEFENEMKLEYVGNEDEIIRRIELGNVSFNSGNSLITGSQSLFGVKTELQFGKLYVTSVLSQQKGELSSVQSKGGARTEEFEIRASEYDENQHYFLTQYFRENYRIAFDQLPVISTNIIIRKVEVWVSQTSAGTKDARDIVAFAELGDELNPGAFNDAVHKYKPPKNGTLYNKVTSIAGIRDISQVSQALESRGLQESVDFERFEQAELLKPTQYTVNNDLGYISFKSKINREKTIGVAIEYEYNGKIYRVGEFSSDLSSPNALVVKLLKGRRISPDMKNWDLMMRNVYSIGGYQVNKEDFYMEIFYEDDRTGTPINYFPEGPEGVKGQSIIKVLGFDKLTEDGQPFEDGVYDFVEGVTMYASNGKIFLTKPEPFGEDLKRTFGADSAMAEDYMYNELYDSTKTKAKEYINKNKFLIRGMYKSSSSSIIRLNATNVKEESVKVTSQGRELQKDADYRVNAEMGEVEILNSGLLESGADIQVDFESDPLFSIKTKTMMGTRAEYRFNDNVSLGGTVLRLKETPLTHKVGFEDFPINNTMWGLDGTYTTPSRFLTRMVDYIPLVETKELSKITVKGEFAQIVPKISKDIDPSIEIDYFESTQHKYSIKEPSSWRLAGTPQGVSKYPEAERTNDLSYSYHRAHIAWFNINSQFYSSTENLASSKQLSDPFAHGVMRSNLFPNYDEVSGTERPMTILNLAYYPTERGQYNYTVDGLDPATGRLKNPENNWGGIMRDLTSTDFDESNVEYIEFWLMDPFHGDSINNRGGDLVINLGDISEDILPDGRKAAENGNGNDTSKFDKTVWGRVPNYYVIEDQFDNTISRNLQDIGYDGLNDDEEARHFELSYLSRIRSYITNAKVVEEIETDPSKDNFYSYMDMRGQDELSIIQRYKYINNAEGDSPTGGAGTGGLSSYPEVEDINGNYTLDMLEDYYEYTVSIRPGSMSIGQNFVTDIITETTKLADNSTENILWYQFKVPIRTTEKRVVGSINSFQNIPFMRMYLTNFADSIILRFADLNFVTSSWRKYDEDLFEAGDYDMYSDADFDVSVVNIEENSERKPVNYVLPPGVDRVVDPGNQALRELNEQALELKVVDLEDGTSKAVFKEVNRDYRQFGRIKMYVHAEEIEGKGGLDNGDLYAFIRIGSDYTKNYYEYEIPLALTPLLDESQIYDPNSVDDREAVWPGANNFDILFTELTGVKKERQERINAGDDVDVLNTYYSVQGRKRIAIKGNPNLGNVRGIMLGIRNRKKSTDNTSDDGMPKSAVVWFNELRLTDFEDKGGWAATAQSRVDLADFASVSMAGRTSKPGFGGIDQKVYDRSQEDLYQYDVGSNVALNKFFPEQLGLSIPFYTSVSETFIIPKYDPLNPDLTMKESLSTYDGGAKDEHRRKTIDYTKKTSFNFTNVRMSPEGGKNYPWSVKNFSAGYGYSKSHSRDVSTVHENEFQHKAQFNYNYVLSPRPIEPFKKSVKNKQLKIIRDFNVYYLPMSVSMGNSWDKRYKETQRRKFSLVSGGYDEPGVETYSKHFNWDRTYNLKYNFSKGLKFDYSATNESRISEPEGKIDKDSEEWDPYKEEVISNFKKFGVTTGFNQQSTVTYKLPINKIEPLNWVNSNYRYTGNYQWERGAEILNTYTTEDSKDTYTFYGHNIKNSNNQSVDVRFNMKGLYKKSKYLKEIDREYSRSRKRRSNNARTKNVKFTKESVSLKAGKTVTINHRLGTTDVKVNVVDSKGTIVKGSTEVLSKNKVLFTPASDHDNVKIVVNGKKKDEETPASKVMDRLVYTSMMVKSVSVTYSWNNGSYIPHYFKKTKYVGLDDPFGNSYANPGWDYVFGYVPSHEDIVSRAEDNEWFVDPAYGGSSVFNQKYTRSYGNKLGLKATLEPLDDLKISLDSDRSYSHNRTQLLVPVGDSYQEGLINGNYSMSTNTFATAFDSDGAFEDLKSNRVVVANRLAREGGHQYEVDPKTGYPSIYSENSQDVLIPAFIAAYTGQDPNDVYTEGYFKPLFYSFKDFVRTINWRVTYTGLTKIKTVDRVFKRVQLDHKYSSNYSIANYQSFTTETDEDGFYVNPADGAATLAPEYEISAVSISESFKPLFGVDMRWENNFTSKFEVDRSRTVTLAFANTEVSENNSVDYSIKLGYVFENFVLSINSVSGKKTYENDLVLSGGFSVRNNVSVRRNIVQDVTQKVSGQKVYKIDITADYDLSERFTTQLYLQHTINQPVVRGYRSTNSAIGIVLKFTLI